MFCIFYLLEFYILVEHKKANVVPCLKLSSSM